MKTSGLNSTHPTGCPKKMSLLPGFEFLTLGGVFLGVKNTSKNFGNKKYKVVLQSFDLMDIFYPKNTENFVVLRIYGHIKDGKHF